MDDRVINRYQGLKSGLPAAPESTIDKLYNELEMRRRELEDVQRQLLQERKKVEAFVGQDVQMLTVRPVDMTQMNANPVQALAAPMWAGQINTQQQQPQQQQTQQIPGGNVAAPVLMDVAAAMDVAAMQQQSAKSGSDSEQAAGGEEWEQHPAKRSRLDVVAEAVAAIQ